MLNKILMIVVSVTIFGILFFLFIKRALKRRLNEILLEDNKNKKETNKL
jgi:hypothetical protein